MLLRQRLKKYCSDYLPTMGEKMLRYRQSSLWLLSVGSILFKSFSRFLVITFKASVSFEISGKFWGHTGPGESALLIPIQFEGVTGGMNLSLPTGGIAYGIPVATNVNVN